MMIGGANVYGLAMTVMAGYLAQQVAGILYINESKDKVRVATLSFVGHRVDLMYEIEDIIPAADMGGLHCHLGELSSHFNGPHSILDPL